MSKIQLVIAPDPLLNLRSREVMKAEITNQMKEFVQNMLDALYTDPASGYAAVQFGVHKRIIVLDLGNDDETPRDPDFYPKVLINPEFTYKSDNMVVATEGCMSVPDIRVDVPRSDEVEIKFVDIDFNEHILRTDGWLARVIQHEMDHLDGTTLLDYLSALKRDMSLKKLRKLKKAL